MFEDDHNPDQLPGLRFAPCGVFLDTWGTLFKRPAEGFPATPERVEPVPGALDGLFRCSQRGWKIFLIGNQEQVAFGEQSATEWHAVQAAAHELLDRAGIPVAHDYQCTLHPNGRGAGQGESVFQLPNTGPFFHAAHHYDIDLRTSWVVGDETIELVAGWRAGLRTAGVATGLGLLDQNFDVEPELHFRGLPEFLSFLDSQDARAAA
jgi:histidinol phosphatase-like enzyme